MLNYTEKKFGFEIETLDSQIKELNEQKQLLKQVLETKETQDFKHILHIQEIKRITERAYDEEFGLHFVENRIFYEVETEYEKFLIMMDFLGMKESLFYKYFRFCDVIYRLHTPSISKEHTEYIVNFLFDQMSAEEKDEFDSVQILHPYRNEYEKKLSREEEEHLKKLFEEREKHSNDLLNSSFEDTFKDR